VVLEPSWRPRVPAWVPYAAAVLAPLAVALVFPHPSRRVLVPACLMLVVVFVLSVMGGRAPGIVAAVVSAASLWFFNLPPGYTFSADRSDDVASVVLVFAVALGGSLLLSAGVRRTEHERRLANELRVHATTIQHLQQALLPRVVPAVNGVTVSSVYLPARARRQTSSVGGDWYALVPLSDTRLGIGLGDVAGHGLPAVAAMAETRFALRTLALDAADPGSALSRLDRVLKLFQGDQTVSAVYLVVDGADGTLEFANAGHPPPMVRSAGGDVVVLNGDRHGGLLGLSSQDYRSYPGSLEPGDVLLMYTDGLVERRGEHLDVGFARLGACLAAHPGDDLDDLCASLVEQLVGDDTDDDVAIVALRYDGVVVDHDTAR
jgi:hypothetical protein